jgi:nucleotide-binding universal stress UspA family protein
VPAKALDEARAAAEAAGVEAEYELVEGDPAEEIAKFRKSRDADLVVVGTRGLGALAGSLVRPGPHPEAT